MSETHIDESTFDRHAERALRALESAVNDVDGVEADLESGILTIEFVDGARYVVNSHRAARQIWMAAGAEAWHFDPDATGSRWIASKSGDELFACLSARLGAKLGKPVSLPSS